MFAPAYREHGRRCMNGERSPAVSRPGMRSIPRAPSSSWRPGERPAAPTRRVGAA